MESSSFDEQLNTILLKPRFSFEHSEPKKVIIEKFKELFVKEDNNFRGKIIGDHVIIDVAKTDEHFWSPQLQIEIEVVTGAVSRVKGLFGPKPQLWALFMFIHFGVALAFAVFATMLYTDWSLDNDYTLSLSLTITMPVLWVLFYLFGRWGKRKGYAQMVELNEVLQKVLNN